MFCFVLTSFSNTQHLSLLSLSLSLLIFSLWNRKRSREHIMATLISLQSKSITKIGETEEKEKKIGKKSKNKFFKFKKEKNSPRQNFDSPKKKANRQIYGSGGFVFLFFFFRHTFPCRTWNSNRRPESWTYRHLADHSPVDDMDFVWQRSVPLPVLAVAVAVGLAVEHVGLRKGVQRLRLH